MSNAHYAFIYVHTYVRTHVFAIQGIAKVPLQLTFKIALTLQLQYELV